MKDDHVYLGHIREAIHDIQQYTATGRDAFMADRMRQGDIPILTPREFLEWLDG